jgi:hypothetical protein
MKIDIQNINFNLKFVKIQQKHQKVTKALITSLSILIGILVTVD